MRVARVFQVLQVHPRAGTSEPQNGAALHPRPCRPHPYRHTQFLDNAVVRDRLADHWIEILGFEVTRVNHNEKIGPSARMGGGGIVTTAKLAWREETQSLS